MVASSKMKKALDRVIKAQPYLTKLENILKHLGGSSFKHPLLEKRAVRKSLIFLVTANRGLCGSYNSNLIRMTEKLYKAKQDQNVAPSLYVCGRKGVAYFKFKEYPLFRTYTELSDKPDFEAAKTFGTELMDLYINKEFDEILVIYSHYISTGKQPATTMQLLPFQAEEDEKEHTVKSDIIFEPTPEEILRTLVPLSIQNAIFRVFIEAVACEQFARRVAMKNATDAAEEMERSLVLNYNKSRQAQITQEISEIVGGVEALK